jgi:predicted nucleic acid-binding protein
MRSVSDRPFIILPDTNTWIESHLFTTPVGAAATYYLTRVGGRILLPEVVETELLAVARRHAKISSAAAASAVRDVKRFTAHAETNMPTVQQVESALTQRLIELKPHLLRVEIDLVAVRAALERVVLEQAPNSDKREQYRDSLVWECALRAATESDVAFITADSDFWEKGQDSGKRPKGHIYEDIRALAPRLKIYPAIDDLLVTLKQSVSEPDHEEVAEDLTSVLRETIASELNDLGLNLRGTSHHKIAAFPTGESKRIAISFEFTADASEILDGGAVIPISAKVRGSCFLDMSRGAYTDIALAEIEVEATTTSTPRIVIFRDNRRVSWTAG